MSDNSESNGAPSNGSQYRKPFRQKKFNAFPFDYGEIIELKIDDITNLGSGVGRVKLPAEKNGADFPNGWVVMVKFALPTETVRARVYKNYKNFSEADLLEVLTPSPERVEPKCPLFGTCGGCQYQHLNYPAQLEWKRKQVVDLMKRIGGIEFPVESPKHSDKIYGYRSKLTPHYEKPRDGNMPVGFVMNGRRSTLVDVENCPIASDAINEALPIARQNIRKVAHKLRRGGTLLLRDCGGRVETDFRARASEKVGDITYEFCAGEFFQNNPFVLPMLIKYAVEEAKGDGIDSLTDTYCGVGIFALAAAKDFKNVAGIEISEAAIQCAVKNAETNEIKNCEFFAGKSEEIFKGVAEKFVGEKTSVVIDPPRSGCDESFLSQLAAFAPAKLVYVSCAPDTQARDLKYLVANGYEIEKLQPFDLFPNTRHIENVATLVRKKS